ncbi:MAG: hypothetical protein HQK53_05995 [Oligoflexia bacterium]|nr:hypothetical protein [Oligoflexia bacterium]
MLRNVAFIVQKNVVASADEHLIEICLKNLIENSWKYTSKRKNGQIEFGSMEDKHNKTTFFVRDNGIGFDMNFSEDIFKPFYRSHSGDKFAGAGIGLTIVARIIQKHGGLIWTKGEPQEGATFYFTLRKVL